VLMRASASVGGPPFTGLRDIPVILFAGAALINARRDWFILRAAVAELSSAS
jgi:hypothetical protein